MWKDDSHFIAAPDSCTPVVTCDCCGSPVLSKILNASLPLLDLPREHGILCAADAVFGECRSIHDAFADLSRAADVQPNVVPSFQRSFPDSSGSSGQQWTYAAVDATTSAITRADVSMLTIPVLTNVTIAFVINAIFSIALLAITTLSGVRRLLPWQSGT